MVVGSGRNTVNGDWIGARYSYNGSWIMAYTVNGRVQPMVVGSGRRKD